MIKYNKLFALLEERGLTYTDLQKKADVSYSVINSLRNNREVGTSYIDKICLALNCQPDDIMEYAPEEI